MSKRTTKTTPTTVGKAAIYVRVSSERQAMGPDETPNTSPRAQEQACREHCERRGYLVVDVYRDTERYRAGRRLVEPSATRADRPQFRRLIADADAGHFDTVIAWREDRLYRAFRPMLDFIECIERNHTQVELTNDTFDPRFAEVKAWAAKMELEAKHERFIMGVSGRLEQGKAWNNPPAYGWRRVEGRLEIEPAEAHWVRRIWGWYADGVTARDIRRRLIAGGAPERRTGNKTPWSPSYIYLILHRDAYHTGQVVMKWGDDTHTLTAPPIVEPALAEAVKRLLGRKQKYPARNLKADYLGAGLLYCKACDVRMTARTVTRRDRPSGQRAEYSCFRNNIGAGPHNCAKTISAPKLDPIIWRKFWNTISDPDEFERQVAAHIATVRTRQNAADADVSGLEERLDNLMLKRQEVMTWALDKKITADDMALRLAGMELEQASLTSQLSDARLLVGDTAERLLEAAELYRAEVQAGAVAINAEPTTPAQAALQFAARRKLLDALVSRIDLEPDGKVTIHTVWDLSGHLPVEVRNSVTAAS